MPRWREFASFVADKSHVSYRNFLNCLVRHKWSRCPTCFRIIRQGCAIMSDAATFPRSAGSNIAVGANGGRSAKIILINRYFHPDLSATSQMVSNLAFALAARGYDMHAITSRQCHDNSSAALPRHETIRGVTVHRIETSRFGRGNLLGRAVDYATFHAAA